MRRGLCDGKWSRTNQVNSTTTDIASYKRSFQGCSMMLLTYCDDEARSRLKRLLHHHAFVCLRMPSLSKYQTNQLQRSDGAQPTTAGRAKRENGGLGEDPPGNPMTHQQDRWACPRLNQGISPNQGI
jgi:hypothetical protein